MSVGLLDPGSTNLIGSRENSVHVSRRSWRRFHFGTADRTMSNEVTNARSRLGVRYFSALVTGINFKELRHPGGHPQSTTETTMRRHNGSQHQNISAIELQYLMCILVQADTYTTQTKNGLRGSVCACSQMSNVWLVNQTQCKNSVINSPGLSINW